MFFLFVLLLLCAVPLLWYNMGQIIKSLQFVDLCLSVCLSVCLWPLIRSQFSLDLDETLEPEKVGLRHSPLGVKIRSPLPRLFYPFFYPGELR